MVDKPKDMIQSLDDIIQQRRSIRKYKLETPPREWIEKMIWAAGRAPSASNTQPVRFLEINSNKIKQALHESMNRGRDRFLKDAESCDGPKRLKNLINTYYRYSEWMFKAPLLLAGCVHKSTSGFSKRLFESGLLNAYEPKDLDLALGLALKGFILKGETLGLGSCILTAPLAFINDMEEILGMDDLSVRCFITVGFPDESPGPVERRPVTEILRSV